MGGDSRFLPPLLTVKPCDGFLRSSKYVEGITGDLMKFARRSLAIVAISTLAALAAACGSDDSTEDVLLVALNEMNGSGQSGHAMFVADDDQTDERGSRHRSRVGSVINVGGKCALILLISNELDVTADFFEEKLKVAKVSYLRMNTPRLPDF